MLDDFLTTPVAPHTAAELLNILAAREGRGSTLVTSQFDPPDWYKSLQDAVIAESILNRIVAGAEIIALDVPNIRRTSPRQRHSGPAVGRVNSAIRYPSDRYPIIRTALSERRPKHSVPVQGGLSLDDMADRASGYA